MELHFLMPQDSKNLWVRELHALNATVVSSTEWKLHIKRDCSFRACCMYPAGKIQGAFPRGLAAEVLQLGELQISLRGKSLWPMETWKGKKSCKTSQNTCTPLKRHVLVRQRRLLLSGSCWVYHCILQPLGWVLLTLSGIISVWNLSG